MTKDGGEFHKSTHLYRNARSLQFNEFVFSSKQKEEKWGRGVKVRASTGLWLV